MPRPHERIVVGVSIARATLARLDLLAKKTGLARGRIVDLALDALEPCEVCDGDGSARDERGDLRRCYECAGVGFHPRRT